MALSTVTVSSFEHSTLGAKAPVLAATIENFRGGYKAAISELYTRIMVDWSGLVMINFNNFFDAGVDVIPWLGKLDELGPATAVSVNPYTTPNATPPFPVKVSIIL